MDWRRIESRGTAKSQSVGIKGIWEKSPGRRGTETTERIVGSTNAKVILTGAAKEDF